MDRLIYDARPEKRARLTLDDPDRGDGGEVSCPVLVVILCLK